MNGQYAYTSYIWPSIFAVIMLVALAIYSWRRRSVPGVIPFLIGCMCAVLWAFMTAMMYAAVEPSLKVWWYKFGAIFQLPIVIAVTCFVLEYAWPGRWLTRRNLVLLSIPWLLYIALSLTNDLHHLLWLHYQVGASVDIHINTIGWLTVGYAFVVLEALNLIVFGWLFFHSTQHRLPVLFMLVGQITGRMLFLLDKVSIIQSELPLGIFGMAFEFLMYAIALFGFHIFDPVSLARQAVFAQMRTGVLILDRQGRIASLNPAAEQILDVQAKLAQDKPARDLLPDCTNDALGRFSEIETELSFGEGDGIRYYTMTVSLLQDFRGLDAGRLLMLRDVTGQKRAQAKILEQQRALAMLQEREQLARELHDNLGQVFAFVNVQGQTVRHLLERGEVSAADEHVGRLLDVTHEADVDIRESILGLRAALSECGLIPSLRQYLSRYEKNYGIHIRLEGCEAFTSEAFEPLVEVQLLRILQEALTNVRKHAGATTVRIMFARRDGFAHVTIRDDGKGFDTVTRDDGLSDHVGLRVMRERAEDVGGSLNLSSRPGQGTELVVSMPLRGAVHA